MGKKTLRYLTPSWSTQSNSKDGKKPCVRFTEVCQDPEHDSPYPDEESNDKNEDLPFRNIYFPEVTPVASIWLSYNILINEV